MNKGYIYREVIGSRAAGQRLDLYVSGRYTHSSLARWREHIVAGRVLLNGARPAVDARLGLGQRLEWHRPPWREPDAPLALPVLYDRGGVLVVDKPAGLPTMAGGGFLENTLVHQLRLVHPLATPMHRLGRWTSGVVLCACGPSLSASLAAQFASRTIDKRYRALVWGLPTRDAFAVEVPIGPVPYPPLGTVHAARPDGRPSSSHVTVIERRRQSSLCDVSIATGRPHQIRIHLAAAGHPLVGDPLYEVGGHPSQTGVALPGSSGYHLHAAEIGFRHAGVVGQAIVTAEPPRILRTALEI